MEPVAEVAAWIVGIAAAGGVLTKLVKGLWNLANAIRETREIVMELKPNAGGSVNDKITTIHNKVERLEERMNTDENERKHRQEETDAWRMWVMHSLGSKSTVPFQVPMSLTEVVE